MTTLVRPETESPETLTPELLSVVAADPAELESLVAPFRAVDVAEALNGLPRTTASKVITHLPFDSAVQVLNEPELEHRGDIVRGLERGVAAALLAAMAPDRRAELLRELPAPKRRKVLSEIEEPDRSMLATLLNYPERTAGSIMTTQFVAVSDKATVADAIARVRAVPRDRDPVYTVYVTSHDTGALARVVGVQELLGADPETAITTLGDARTPLAATPIAPVDDVARLISKYNLVALPILDDRGRIVGNVTVDDVIDEMVAQSTSEVQRFGGSEALDRPYLQVSFLGMVQKRAGWLAVLFLGEMLTATAMGYYQNEIARAVVLSLFLPLIISSGGNSGSQATSLIIRALALRELTVRDWWRVLVRELPTGLTLGAILGVIGVVRILTWQHLGWFNYGVHSMLLAVTIGVALVGVVTFGSLAGSMLPFILRRLGFDPASASAPLVATLVDVTGLVIYFSVAVLILRGTLL